MLKKFKKLLYPVDYVINNFDNIPEDLLAPTNGILNYRFHVANGLLAEIRGLHFLGENEYFQDHLAKLKTPEADDVPEISYSLTNEARRLLVYCDPAKTQNQTVVCSVAIGDAYRKTVAACLRSQENYAQRAGADYVRLDRMPAHADRHAAWYKIALIFRLMLEGYDRVLFIDADAMVMNDNVSLETLFGPLIESGRSLLIAEDEGGINTGVVLAQKNSRTYRLLDLLWLYHLGAHVPNWEQQALGELMTTYKAVRNLVLIAADPKSINSFPNEREHIFKKIIQQNTWTAGDFICHFSGIRSPVLEKLIEYYAPAAAEAKS